MDEILRRAEDGQEDEEATPGIAEEASLNGSNDIQPNGEARERYTSHRTPPNGGPIPSDHNVGIDSEIKSVSQPSDLTDPHIIESSAAKPRPAGPHPTGHEPSKSANPNLGDFAGAGNPPLNLLPQGTCHP